MTKLALYFSGTGNTKYCVEQFIKYMPTNIPAYSIENIDVANKIKNANEIILAYPIYYSNMPLIMRDFINYFKEIWYEKKVFLITTMGLFSGDGCGVGARLLKKHGATISGGLHLIMSDCIIDEKILKKKPEEEERLINQTNTKIKQAAQRFLNGNPTQDGLSCLARILGLFGQRLWFKHKTATYHDLPNINSEKCVGCNRCVKRCPKGNLSLTNRKATHSNQCILCYRCVHTCPTQAITILGKRVVHRQSNDCRL